MRIGAKKKPFYRVVVVDERAKRTGGYIELLGTYNPLTEPKDIKLKKDRIDYWIKQGAQPSVGYLRIIGKAPKRPPRKPRKEKKAESSAISPQTSDKTEVSKADEPSAKPEERVATQEESAGQTENKKPAESTEPGQKAEKEIVEEPEEEAAKQSES